MLALLLAAASISQDAPAPEPTAPTFSYNYVEFGVFTTEIDAFDENSVGVGVNGSYGFHPNVAVVAAVEYETVEVGGIDIDAAVFGIGLNGHVPVHDRVDLVAQARFISTRTEALNVSDSETGYDLGVGVRTMPVDRLELAGGIVHTDIYDGNTNVRRAARFYATEAISLGFGTTLDSDGNSYGLNLRVQM